MQSSLEESYSLSVPEPCEFSLDHESFRVKSSVDSVNKIDDCHGAKPNVSSRAAVVSKRQLTQAEASVRLRRKAFFANMRGGVGKRSKKAKRKEKNAALGSSSVSKNEKLAGGVEYLISQCKKSSLGQAISDRAEALYICSKSAIRARKFPDEIVIGSCIYIACALAGPHMRRTYYEITKLMELKNSRGIFARAIKCLVNASKLDMSHLKNTSMFSEDFLPRFCTLLKLPEGTVDVCTNIVVQARKLGITTEKQTQPLAIVASSIYFVCRLFGIGKSLADVCAAFDINERYILATYDLLHAAKEDLLKEEWAGRIQAAENLVD